MKVVRQYRLSQPSPSRGLVRGRSSKDFEVSGILALARASNWEPSLRVAPHIFVGHFAVHAEQSAKDSHMDVCHAVLAVINAASAAPTRICKVLGAAVADFIAALLPTRQGAVCRGTFGNFVGGDLGFEFFVAHGCSSVSVGEYVGRPT